MRQSVVFLITLLLSLSIHGMEIKNWDYKERHYNYYQLNGLVNLFFNGAVAGRQYPYFLPEKETNNPTRSLRDDLLFVNRVALAHDIRMIILAYSYATEKIFDADIRKKLIDPYDILWREWIYLDSIGKRALLWLVENRSNVIEGRDKEFAPKMYTYFLSLPASIREKIVKVHGKDWYINTHYESSLRNTLLGETHEDYHKNRQWFAQTAQFITIGGALFLYHNNSAMFKYCFAAICPHYGRENAAQQNRCSIVYDKVLSLLEENEQSRQQRFGFEIKSLLPEQFN